MKYPIKENNYLSSCFKNDNPKTNGEYNLFQNLAPNQVVFDVGSRYDSEFLNYEGEVHYFEPVPEFIEALKAKNTNINKLSVFNNCGLSSKEGTVSYYPLYQSFYNRINSCQKDDKENVKFLHVIKGKNYLQGKNINRIQLLKIDVEGHEPDVIYGFEDEIKKVDIVQFEYGGTYLDNHQSLKEIVEYLQNKGFNEIGYLNYFGYVKLLDLKDHYDYCNIVCFNSESYR